MSINVETAKLPLTITTKPEHNKKVLLLSGMINIWIQGMISFPESLSNSATQLLMARTKKPAGKKSERDRSRNKEYVEKKKRHSENASNAKGLIVGGKGGVKIGPKTYDKKNRKK